MADSHKTDVNDAVYRLVHDFGAQRLSSLTGTPTGTILNKANPNESSHHKPTLADGIVWTNLSGDLRIAQAFARSCGGVHVDLRYMAEQSDEALLDLVLRRGQEEGQADRALEEVLGAGALTRAAFETLRREEFEAIAARLTVLLRVEGLVRG